VSVFGCGDGETPLDSLVSCLRGSFAKSLDLVENRIGGGGPDKRFAPFVVVILAKKRAAWFNQLALVGVKCRW
jgi:hypothetical protein